jgi:hypothetical protein
MNYIQKGYLDDKIVSQLLQTPQTFFVTVDFLSQLTFIQSFNDDPLSTMTDQTIVFGKYINLFSALIYKM